MAFLLSVRGSRGNALGRDARRVRHERATRERSTSAERGRRAVQASTAPVFVYSTQSSSNGHLAVKAQTTVHTPPSHLQWRPRVRNSSPGDWLLSVLRWSALGCGAALAASCSLESAPTLAEGNTEAADTSVNEKLSRMGVPEGTERALHRRQSCGKERLLVSKAAVRGDRARMEDTSYVSDCKRFSAVFDGHGGSAVSEYLKSHLFTRMAPDLGRLDAEVANDTDGSRMSHIKRGVETMLCDALDRVDSEVIARLDWKYQGSTAVGVLLYDDAIFSFNVGDSRAVLSRGGHTIDLTRDHKPNDPIELERIEKLGGNVRWYGYVDAQGVPIEPYGAYRVNGNLAVARAIGDRDLRPYVTGQAEIKQFARDFAKDEFIVIASDGLWDVFTSEEAVTFVHDVLNGELGGRESWRSGGHNDTSVPIFEWSHQFKTDRGMIKAARARRKTQIASYLVEEALYRGTSDNVSVIVVWLK